MDGLECTEILLSQLERTNRLDSEFYKKKSLEIVRLLQSMKATPLTNYVNVSDGNHMGISEKFIEEGIPYYRGQDIHSFFIEDSNPICIDEDTFNVPYMHRSHLKKGDILLSIVGTIGEVALVSKDEKATCNCKLAILRPHDIKHSALIAIYLKTNYGFDQVDKFKRGAVQMGYLLEDMDQILMPDFSDEFANTISKIVEEIKVLTDRSNKQFLEAEECLLKAIGINMSEITNGGISVKTFAESLGTSGRIDAEYYQPKYEQIENAIKKGEFMALSEMSDIQIGEFIPETLYGDIGVSYIRGTEITSKVINIGNSVHVNTDISELKTIEKGDLAFAMIGSVGNVSLNDEKTAIVSNNLGTIKLHNKELSHYLLVYLLSDVGQALFEKYQTRTAQPKIKKEDVGDFLIPILPDAQIRHINSMVKESFSLKKMSETLIECAIKAVEMAIETNEEKAISWLESQKSKEI